MTHVTVLIEEEHLGQEFLSLPQKTRMCRVAIPDGKTLNEVRLGFDNGTFIFAPVMVMRPEKE